MVVTQEPSLRSPLQLELPLVQLAEVDGDLGEGQVEREEGGGEEVSGQTLLLSSTLRTQMASEPMAEMVAP